MPRRLSTVDAASLALIVAATLVGLAALPRLPEEVAIRFTASGTPGNYVHRSLGVLTVPAGMVGTLLVLKLAARIDPPDDTRAFAVIVLSAMLLFTGSQFLLLGWNLGYRVPFAIVAVVVTLWTLAVAGYTVVREA